MYNLLDYTRADDPHIDRVLHEVKATRALVLSITDKDGLQGLLDDVVEFAEGVE